MTGCPPPEIPPHMEGAWQMCRGCGRWWILDFDHRRQSTAWRLAVPIELEQLDTR